MTSDQYYTKEFFESHDNDYTEHSESLKYPYNHNKSLKDSNSSSCTNGNHEKISVIQNLPDENNELYTDQHHRSPSQSLSVSEGLESVHTMIDDDLISRTDSYTLEKTYGTSDAECSSSQTIKVPPLEPKLDPIAWVLLFFVVLLRAAIGIFNSTFSPIPSVTANFLGVSLTSINWLYNVTYITYMISCFFTSWMYNMIGIKWSLVLSGITLSVGCWIRWIAVKINPPSFSILMVGQTIASFSSPISLNIMTMFATMWFTENFRATASVFIVSNYGTIIAMFLLPRIATGSDKIEFTVILVASIASASTIPLFFFPNKPRTPVSYSAANEKLNGELKEPNISLRQSAILLLKNHHFLILGIIHGLNTGTSSAWSALMNQAITPYGYSDNQVGNIAAIGVIGGSLGFLIAGPILDRTKQHKVFLKIMSPLMFSTYVALIFVVKAESFAAILYVNFLNQFFVSFMIPICIELGVEVSYPITDSLPTSILWQMCQLLGIILTTVMDLFRDPNGTPKNNMFKALVFQAIIAGICFLFSCIFKGPMLRLKAYEKQEKLRRESIHGA